MSARDEARLLGTAFSGGYGGGGYPMGGRSRLVDLIMARGQQQAEAARASGDLWGNAINSIGQNISGAIQQYGEEQKIKKRDAAWLGVLNDPAVMSDPKALYIKSTEVWGPQDGPKMFQGVAGAAQLMQPKRDPERDAKALPAVGAAYLKLGPEARPAVYPQIRAMIRGAFPDIQMPDRHDPAFDEKVVAPFIQGLQPAPEFMTGAPGSGIVNKSTGQITGTVPDRPAAPPKPPEVGSFGDYLTRTYGEQPTPQQILDARKAYGQADDRPRITVNTGGAAADSGDTIADAWAAGMAFPSTQAATTAALDSFKRRGLPVPRKLSTSMQQDVIRSTDTLQTIADVRDAYEKVKGTTGPLSYRLSEWQQKIPGLDANPDFVTFNTLLRGMTNLDIKRITGAQMSEQEADRLLKGMATGTLKPGDFEAALNVMERNARRNRDITLYGRADASGSGNRAPAAAAPAAQARPRATNPQTGEQVEWNGSAWVPVK